MATQSWYGMRLEEDLVVILVAQWCEGMAV